jgi:hypothetical protein
MNSRGKSAATVVELLQSITHPRRLAVLTIQDAVEKLRAAGLSARHTPDKAFCEIMVDGDSAEPSAAVQGFPWVCWIAHHEAGWLVCLPPHPAPGPGPRFVVATLEEAVSLTLFAFARRPLVESLPGRRKFELAQSIYSEWLQQRGK